jgi:co-chaperonin GroES (HSP10)|nr:MAG TPA: cpn10 [Crassvirales sp.]
MKRIRPINDYVIIKKTEQEMRKVGSIFIPETRNELTRKSDVVAMNAGRNDVKVGDTVIHPSHAGTPFFLGDDEFVAIHDKEIICILDEVDEE